MQKTKRVAITKALLSILAKSPDSPFLNILNRGISPLKKNGRFQKKDNSK
ncbi:hypothetical protein ACJVDH_05785 [Pedobacter sp. AW1-32]